MSCPGRRSAGRAGAGGDVEALGLEERGRQQAQVGLRHRDREGLALVRPEDGGVADEGEGRAVHLDAVVLAVDHLPVLQGGCCWGPRGA